MKPDSGKDTKKPKLRFYCDKPACFAHYVANEKIKITKEEEKPDSGKEEIEWVSKKWHEKQLAASEARMTQLNDSLIRMNADAEKLLGEKDMEIASLKKETQYLRAMLSGGATKAIGKLGVVLGAACLSNTLSEIDIRKDERNKARSEFVKELEGLKETINNTSFQVKDLPYFSVMYNAATSGMHIETKKAYETKLVYLNILLEAISALQENEGK